MAHKDARTVASIERHRRWFPDAIGAVGELIRVLGDVDPFLVVDERGDWRLACAGVDDDFEPVRWIERRELPAGDWEELEAEGMRAERLVARDEPRPAWLVAMAEVGAGENEDEPGGESFGTTSLVGRTAGMRRIGVNVDVVHPGQRSCRYHWHRLEEEGFLVLEGSGWLDVGETRYRVRAGDFFAKIEGPQRPHQFVNDGDTDLRIVSIGERRPDDEVQYPQAPWTPPPGELR